MANETASAIFPGGAYLKYWCSHTDRSTSSLSGRFEHLRLLREG